MKTIEELYKFYGIENGKIYKITKINKDFTNYWWFEKGDKFKIADGDLLKFTDESKGTFVLYCLSNFDYEEYIEILDDKEIKYLSAVIKPFRKDVIYISKENIGGGEAYISIQLSNDLACLPYFKADKMYKGMELNRVYTLEELGL